jgi:hypothetical protein
MCSNRVTQACLQPAQASQHRRDAVTGFRVICRLVVACALVHGSLQDINHTFSCSQNTQKAINVANAYHLMLEVGELLVLPLLLLYELPLLILQLLDLLVIPATATRLSST